MTVRALPLVLPLVIACAKAPGEPAFATNTLSIEIAQDGSITGFQNWRFFDAELGNGKTEDHFVCSALLELNGQQSAEGCESCVQQWSVTTTFVEDDCPEATLDRLPELDQLAQIGIGAADPDALTSLDTPVDVGTWVKFERSDWLAHGWMEDDAGLPLGENWSDYPSIQMNPGFVWDLSEGTTENVPTDDD